MKMSVTRALAELKRIDERIGAAIADGQFVAVTVGQGNKMKVHGNNLTVEDLKGKLQGNLDRITEMMSKRSRLKSAIVASNAVVKVNVGGREMTVAEAIEMKATVLNKEQLLRQMQAQLNSSNAVVSKLNAQLDAQIEANLATIYGADKAKADKDTYEAVAKPQREQKEAALLDPMKIADYIQKLGDEISVIRTELDFILSEVNAKTDIEVE